MLRNQCEAVREALTNALCHRMFHNTSSSVGIAIYDDRVEIENTGHLPDELTVETIKHINPNLSEGYIAMLYPEVPNHPMQSYYLTKKGRELLERL